MKCKIISKTLVPSQQRSSKPIDNTSLNVTYSKQKSLSNCKYIIAHNFNVDNMLLIALDYEGNIIRGWSYVKNSNDNDNTALKYILPMRCAKLLSLETLRSVLEDKLLSVGRAIFINNSFCSTAIVTHVTQVMTLAKFNIAADKLTMIPYDDTVFHVIETCRRHYLENHVVTNNNIADSSILVKKKSIPTYKQVKALDKNISYKEYMYIYG